MIDRAELRHVTRLALQRSRCVGLSGPRQCGKTTLARELAELEGATAFFDLEDPTSLARLSVHSSSHFRNSITASSPAM
jgi:hypothetical protein